MLRPGLLRILAITLSLCCFSLKAQERPKVGVTLSGGGAKGLAHIGLLKAIDSAGIHVDYVSGTSMGAVIGSMYAAGYSGNQIDSLFTTIDFNQLLSNAPVSINLRERENTGRYIELPLKKGKLSFNRGIIESNELWLKLSEVFFSDYHITDFSKFPKPFQCIATDAATGETVILSQGNIVDAIRASMAIPSLFTAVQIDGRILVDGGIRSNFPVSNAKAMGADLVIGSDVSGVLKPMDQMVSPLDIISRLPFYDASSDLEEQKKRVDLYVSYDLDGFGTGSFASADEIRKIGHKKGQEIFQHLKQMKDSLDLIYGRQEVSRIPKRVESVYVRNFKIEGLQPDAQANFRKLLNVEPGRFYSPGQISKAVRKVFATRLYTKINYRLEGLDNQANIVFEVMEAAPMKALFGVHYNSTTGVAIKAGLQKRGFLNPLSTASVIVAAGENTRGVATFLSYLNPSRTLLWQAQANFCSVRVNTYNEDQTLNGLYAQTTQDSDLQAFWQPSQNWSMGFGITQSIVDYTPQLTSGLQARGNISYNTGYFFLQHESLDADIYPHRGRRISFNAGLVFNQRPDYGIYQDDLMLLDENSGYLDFGTYQRVFFNYQEYIPVGRHSFFLDFETGMNFNYGQIIMNDFMVGGLNRVIRNQITFAGLPEGAIFCASAANLKLGMQYTLARNLFLKPHINGLAYDFVKSNLWHNKTKHALGGAVTLAYRTFLGAIETSLMYSNQNNVLLPYFNLGYALQL